MQVVKTSNGELTFERTWVNGQIHIGKLLNGGYAHIGGSPVTMRREIEDTVPQGKHLTDALNWFDNKDKVREAPKKKIIINEEGDYIFEDGSSINSVGDLLGYFVKGKALDNAVAWYTARMESVSENAKKEKEEIAEKTEEGQRGLKKSKCMVCNEDVQNNKMSAHMQEHIRKGEVSLK